MIRKILAFLDRMLFSFMWLAVGLVGAYDTYSAIKFRDDLVAGAELNPIGAWLISVDGGDVSLFLGLKFAGTVLVLGILIYIYLSRRSYAWCLMIPVFLFQVGLAVYLTTGFNF